MVKIETTAQYTEGKKIKTGSIELQKEGHLDSEQHAIIKVYDDGELKFEIRLEPDNAKKVFAAFSELLS